MKFKKYIEEIDSWSELMLRRCQLMRTRHSSFELQDNLRTHLFVFFHDLIQQLPKELRK